MRAAGLLDMGKRLTLARLSTLHTVSIAAPLTRGFSSGRRHQSELVAQQGLLRMLVELLRGVVSEQHLEDDRLQRSLGFLLDLASAW